MMPTRLQYILAYSFEIAAALGILAAWTFGLFIGVDGAAPVMDMSYIGGVLLLVVLGAPGGAVLGLLFLFPVLKMAARRLNGGPFRAGDAVRILRGTHRDTVTTVYEVWDSRDELRADLGEAHKSAVTDVFATQEVCRERLS